MLVAVVSVTVVVRTSAVIVLEWTDALVVVESGIVVESDCVVVV